MQSIGDCICFTLFLFITPKEEPKLYDVLIIGCGIVGAAAAWELSRYRLRTIVLEEKNDVAAGTTKANSAILHAGYDPPPGTLMARLNVEGSRMAEALCAALDVPYRKTGSLVLAFSREERALLEELLRRGERNCVPGLELLDREALSRREPGVSPQALCALYAPTAAIVSPWEYALALAETAVRNGTELRLNSGVTALEPLPQGGWRVTAGSAAYESRFVLNAAGVQGERIHGLAAPASFRIRPSRGQYYLLDKSQGNQVSHVVFQCPGPKGKGVLVAPTVHGNLLVGPNAEEISDGEDTAVTAAGLEQVAAMAARSVPGISLRECIRSFAGVRAQAERFDGVDDFIIQEAAPGFFDLAGIKSPGLTAAPAAARYAAGLLREAGLSLEEKPDFISSRRRIRFKELSMEERNALIRQDPSYGRVICRCETVTEGEILAALRGPIPPCSIDGVKRRCGAGLGRCQGGFCGPRVLELLARERGIPPEQVLQEQEDSVVLAGGRI